MRYLQTTFVIGYPVQIFLHPLRPYNASVDYDASNSVKISVKLTHGELVTYVLIIAFTTQDFFLYR